MHEDEPYLAGSIKANLDINEVEEIFISEFPKCTIRESSHYVGGLYLRISFDNSVEFTFECTEKEKFGVIIRGEADNTLDLEIEAKKIGAVLSSTNLCYGLELYNGADEIVFEESSKV